MKDGVTFLRFPQACQRAGRTRSALNYQITAGNFPRPVKISERAAAFPKHEVDQVLTAMAGGVSITELKALVSQIHAERRAGATAGRAIEG